MANGVLEGLLCQRDFQIACLPMCRVRMTHFSYHAVPPRGSKLDRRAGYLSVQPDVVSPGFTQSRDRDLLKPNDNVPMSAQ